MLETRHFYHNFPRARPNESCDDTIRKGLTILRSINEIGIVLAPEIVRWETPVSIGSPSPILVPQTRISFTELSEAELPAHAKTFGPFALEFEIEDLRREGALPVIYMPQPRGPEDILALLGAILVSHLGHVKYTVEQLHQLSQLSDPEQALKMGLPGSEHATSVNPDYTIHLQNSGDNNEIVQGAEIPAKTIRQMLSYIGFRNAPFDAMIGVLSLTQSLFYPTDNEHIDEALAYYRQREWRITAGFNINNKPRARALTADEKTAIAAIDPQFWTREDTVEGKQVRRIDRALVLHQFLEKSPVSSISRVLVPEEAIDEAKALFGDRATVLSLT
jgi:hypothetical protein